MQIIIHTNFVKVLRAGRVVEARTDTRKDKPNIWSGVIAVAAERIHTKRSIWWGFVRKESINYDESGVFLQTQYFMHSTNKCFYVRMPTQDEEWRTKHKDVDCDSWRADDEVNVCLMIAL